jgi:transposase
VVVRLRVRVRKFFCGNNSCERKVFAERLDGVAQRYARRTDRHREALDLIAFALGGEAGAKLAVGLGLHISPDTLLNYVRTSPEACQMMPKVLGVDDWAIRKAHTYGTVLVDLERHRVIDLLPDRTAEAVAVWLKEHPGVELVSRDRANAYAEGIDRGAPNAVQVADRFHLIQNLVGAVERVLDRNRSHLRGVAMETVSVDPAGPTKATEHLFGDHVRDLPREAQARGQRRAERLAKYEQVVKLKGRGLSLDAISERVGVGRRTLIRWLQGGGFPERKPRSDRGSPKLQPYVGHLERRWREGCRNASLLWREVAALGFGGSYDAVYAWSRRMWTAPEHDGERAPPLTRRYSPRQAAWLLLRDEDTLGRPERRFLEELLGRCPDAAATYRLARDFAIMVREGGLRKLDGWLRAAETSDVVEMRRFAMGLRKDEAAVRAALGLPWSNGQVEGQVNRLKMIKRQMYGRANFDLLRKRVLQAA